MLCTLVTPRAATYAMAASRARSSSAALRGGATASINDIALSLKMPVGLPAASRTMEPPAISRVVRSTFAASMAKRFARFMCPSSRLIHTGLSVVIESIQACVGSSPPQLV